MSSRKPKVIFLHGLPGSGKSTIAEDYIKNHSDEDVVRINRDDIRTTLFGEQYHKGNPDKKSEAQVTTVQQGLFREALRKGQTIIDDNTNLNGRGLFNTVKLAREYGAEFEQIHVDVPVEVAKERNKRRGDAGGRRVPDEVIDRMASFGYGPDGKIKNFKISKNGVFAFPQTTEGGMLIADFNTHLEKKNPLKGSAVVLIDVDGSLANNAHDAERYLKVPTENGQKKDFTAFYKSIENAPFNTEVRDLANRMRDEDDLNLVVLTGRDDSRAKELLSFINRSGIKASRVIAKKTGDYRPDFEYKKEIIENLREEGLVPVHAFDDREGSIRTMEEAGIMVSRVATPVFRPNTNLRNPAPQPEVNTVYGSGYCIRCGQQLKSGGNIGPKCRLKN